MRFDNLPAEFQGLTTKVSYVQRVGSTEWSSSCPNCGGVPHKHGGFPDRFRMWTNAHGKNKIMGWCRQCSYVWFPSGDSAPSPEEFEKWRKQRIEEEEQRRREAEQAIKLLKSQKIWEFYHKELSAWAFEILNEWGICKENADFWKLGLIKDYVVYPDKYHSPAISIPVWDFNGEVRNVKVRILNPQSPSDRYRALYKVGWDAPFVARPDIKSKDACLVVEGEKKAMVAAAVKQDIQVVGIPTKTPSPGSLRELDDFKTIYLCLDPDARQEKNGMSPQKRMIDILGKERVKPIDLFGKLDDLILKHDLSLEDTIKWTK